MRRGNFARQIQFEQDEAQKVRETVWDQQQVSEGARASSITAIDKQVSMRRKGSIMSKLS